MQRKESHDKIKNMAQKITMKLGIMLGRIFKLLPQDIRKKITVVLEKMISKSRGKFSSFLYILSNEIVKHMYFSKNEEVFIVKKIFKDLKIRLDVSKKTQRILYLQKLYEPRICNFLIKNLKEGEVFLDIGANVGFYTLVGSQLVGQSGQIIAFEPEKKNFSNLVENVKINNLKNVICINKAVSKINKKSKFFINPLNDGGGSLLKINSYNDDKEKWSLEKIKEHFPKINLEQDTETISLDQLFMTGEIKNPDLIKIDVDGNELNVLIGMQSLFKLKNAPKIICEISQNKEEIIDILNKYNYKTEILLGKNFLFFK